MTDATVDANVEKIERPKPWPDPPDEVVEDDAAGLAISGAIINHPGLSVLEEVIKKHQHVKDKAFEEWMITSLEAGVHESAGRDALLRIGFYAGYDVGCVPLSPLEEEEQLNAQSEVVDELLAKKKDDEPVTPKGYGELKVGMEGKLNGVPVVVRKITKKDVIMRPLNRAIRDKHGMMVSFEEEKAHAI